MSMTIDEVLSRMHNTAVEYYQGGNESKNVYELLMLFHRDIEKAVKLEAVAKSAILIYGVRYNGERAMLITPYRDRKMQELCVLHAAAEKQTESEVVK